MLFYRYSYFINQNDFEFYFKILLSLLVGSLILIFFVQYLRHRSDSKYRDLLIIFVLVGVFARWHSVYKSGAAQHCALTTSTNDAVHEEHCSGTESTGQIGFRQRHFTSTKYGRQSSSALLSSGFRQ